MTSFDMSHNARLSVIGIRCLSKATVVIAAALAALTAAQLSAAQPSSLVGYVDLHTHPMANLAFGGKLIHGAPDVNALIPADSACRHNVRATSAAHALEMDNATHGGWGTNNGCGDYIRAQVIDVFQSGNQAYVSPDYAQGFPSFMHWPRWNDITHQKMYIDWIRRAHQYGLRVLVALATHNETAAASVMGSGETIPWDDRGSADLQILETTNMVQRHSDFMEIARSAADLRRIVRTGKLAVVLGVEIDNIGNFHRIPPHGLNVHVIRNELQRLHALGVRYIFPVHVVDNAFSGTAVYEANFNLSNRHITGRFWSLTCSQPQDSISYLFTYSGFELGFEIVKTLKLGLPTGHPGTLTPAYSPCLPGRGHMNTRGLSPIGETALREMMRLGMLIDIDHMSQRAANRALDIAEGINPGGYPLNSGHNAARSSLSGQQRSENSRTDDQIRRIAALRGLFGVGVADDDAEGFIRKYRAVAALMHDRGVAIGSDFNGIVKGVRPRNGSTVRYDASFPRSSFTPTKQWDYNREGVPHYGLLPDFFRDVGSLPGGARVVRTLNRSAEYFAQMWERAEIQRTHVP